MRRVDIIKKLQDLTYLNWDERAVTSETNGTFLKARSQTSRGDVYYKLSCYDQFRGIYGHESVNELIASRLLEELGIPHVPYKLIHARVVVNNKEHETWLCESRNYRASDERGQALDTFCELHAKPDQGNLDVCNEHGWQRDISQMMAFDYLIGNRDRHGANIEVIFRGNGSVNLAPLFDHGISLVALCYDDESRVARFDSLADIEGNNYLGTHSLEKNLELVSEGVLSSSLLGDDLSWLFEGLEDVLSAIHIEKISEMIALRWQNLVDLEIATNMRGHHE